MVILEKYLHKQRIVKDASQLYNLIQCPEFYCVFLSRKGVKLSLCTEC